MNVLLTGTTGFLDAPLARLLVQEGFQVRKLVSAKIDADETVNTATRIKEKLARFRRADHLI